MPRDDRAPYPARPPRVITHEPCAIARSDGSLSAATVLNLSNEGFCVFSAQPLKLNERIEIRVLGLGRFQGTVLWSSCRQAGGVLEPF